MRNYRPLQAGDYESLPLSAIYLSPHSRVHFMCDPRPFYLRRNEGPFPSPVWKWLGSRVVSAAVLALEVPGSTPKICKLFHGLLCVNIPSTPQISITEISQNMVAKWPSG